MKYKLMMLNRKVICRLYVLLILCFPSYALSEDLDIIPLHFTTVEDIMPLIQPLFGPDVVITGKDNTLMVRAPRQALHEIHSIVNELDKAPAQLRILIRQNVSKQSLLGHENPVYQNYNVVTYKPTTRVYSTAHNAKETEQQLLVLSGHTAHVQIGQLIPYIEQAYLFGNQTIDPNDPNIGQGSTNDNLVDASIDMGYQAVDTGFYVTPKIINPEQVEVLISPFSSGQNNNGWESIDTSEAHTTIIAPLGEWVVLGGTFSTDASINDHVILYSTEGQNQQEGVILIKVENASP